MCLRFAILFTLYLLTSATLITKAQSQETHYLFPEYMPSIVKFKSGQKKQIFLNYNLLTEEMVFDKNGVKLALVNAGQIDTVYIGQKKFIPEGEYFFEVNNETSIPFYIKHKFTLVPPPKKVAYGGTSETSATQSLSHITEGGQIYNMKLSGDYRLLPASVFWLKKGSQYFKITNKKEIMVLLPDKATQIKSLTKSQSIDFQNQKDLVKLLKQL